MALGSLAVPCLDDDDSQGITEYIAKMTLHKCFGVLKDVATGKMTWADFEGTEAHSQGTLKQVLKTVLDYADVLLTTPAMCLQEPFAHWKRRTAKGIVIDEAANMSRADLNRVWGNSLLPCFLAGDDKQLQPVVLAEEKVKDSSGNPVNRHPADGSLSPLLVLKGCGWGVYRMTMQLRMAAGQFDMVWKQLYSDVPLRYGPGCDINLEHHAPGRHLEAFAHARYPQMTPSPAGTLRPIFITCEGTTSQKDKTTKSTFNRGQNTIALDWLVDLVSKTPVEAKDIVIITPYRQNRDVMERMRKREPKYQALSAIPPAMTIDSYQGQEATIIVIVMATTKKSGSGFTSKSHRLNVMLTRHISGLIIFGDIAVGNEAGGDTAKHHTGKASAKGKDGRQRQVVLKGSMKFFVNENMLCSCIKELVDNGRVGKEVWVDGKEAKK
jgi:hypothetical protein